MCDFLSAIVRQDGVLYHDTSNSHSSMVSKCGWRENQPNRKPFFVEAEWNCEGKYPGAVKITRNGEELSPAQVKQIDRFYLGAAKLLKLKNPSMEELEPWNRLEYADILGRMRVKSLPNELMVWHGDLWAYHGSKLDLPLLGKVGGNLRADNGSKLDLPLLGKQVIIFS